MGDPINVPAAPGNTNNVTVPVRTFNEVKTVGLTFIGDHALMNDNASDWTKNGNSIAKPEFTYGKASAPVSRTRDNYLAVKVELEVWPYDAPQMQCTIKGVAAWGQTFETKFPLQGGKQTVIVESAEKLPDKVTKVAGTIEWTVDNGVDGSMGADRSWGHVLYVTMGTPVDVLGMKEVGLTMKRMDAAVDLVGRAGSLDPHQIVAWLMSQVPAYTLLKDPAVPVAYLHPTYTNSVGGAWPLIDWFKYSAECQAICRYAYAVIKHVGCPGDAEVLLVWADPDIDDGKTAQKAPWVDGGGLRRKPTRRIYGDECNAVLVDTHVEEGREYQTFDSGAPDYLGVNMFEACLRLSHGGAEKYYAGGAGSQGTYSSIEGVLTVFHALCWVCSRADVAAPDKVFARVVKVVHRWRDKQGKVI